MNTTLNGHKVLLLFTSFALLCTLGWAENLVSSAIASEAIKYPVYFDTQDKELKISSPRLIWNLESSRGESLDLGNGIIYENDSLRANIENNELHIHWNALLIPYGELTIINELGKEIWTKSIPSGGHWLLTNIKGQDAPPWKNGEKFHFCLRTQNEQHYTRLCSQHYAVLIDDSGTHLARAKSESQARIIFQNEEKKLKGSEEVSIESPVQFLATLNTNATYEFVSAPIEPLIKDMVQTNEGQVALIGSLPAPLAPEVAVLPGENYGKLTRALGFEKTIAEKEDLWQHTLSAKDPLISFPGKSGGVFHYQLTIKDPPTEKDRLFIFQKNLGTYSRYDQTAFIDHEKNEKSWPFETPNKFALNKVTMESHRSYLEVYRGNAGEASLRLTGVDTTNGSFALLGEGHISWWFNDLFGWQNNYLSKQRWGVSAKLFSSLMDFPVSTTGDNKEDISLSVMQMDLRYRIKQGLSERDETVGLIAAYETVTMGSDTVPKLGAGLFWARSMPRSIDYWLNKISFLNYPKWIDMEFISYLSSPDSDVTLSNDLVLNFRGKIFWTPRFFGEAGFGVKNYHYERTSNDSGAELTTIYGTLGLGVNF
ncbi:MAG: hypothetical protein NDI69_09235 [Bacteriovoracaceae bacterium]|nr:hypothetical protein [Bacteriovoracaceae bacterium]